MNGTALGYLAQLTASNSIVLGNSSIRKIYAQVTTITAISDGRCKKYIRAFNSDLGLDFIILSKSSGPLPIASMMAIRPRLWLYCEKP
jgi:hypothetical protein